MSLTTITPMLMSIVDSDKHTGHEQERGDHFQTFGDGRAFHAKSTAPHQQTEQAKLKDAQCDRSVQCQQALEDRWDCWVSQSK